MSLQHYIHLAISTESDLRHRAGHVVDALLQQVRAGQVGGEAGHAPPAGRLHHTGLGPCSLAWTVLGPLWTGSRLIRHWISHSFNVRGFNLIWNKGSTLKMPCLIRICFLKVEVQVNYNNCVNRKSVDFVLYC